MKNKVCYHCIDSSQVYLFNERKKVFQREGNGCRIHKQIIRKYGEERDLCIERGTVHK